MTVTDTCLNINYFGVKFKGQRNVNGFYYHYINGVTIYDVKRKSYIKEVFLFLFNDIMWIKYE